MSNIVAATAVAIDMLNAVIRINQLIQNAQIEGRDLTEEDWKTLDADTDTAFTRLRAAIDNAQT